jgi:phosphoribosylformylglycinamidine cyclo-ligase
LARVLPDDCDAVISRGRWEEPRIFDVIQATGDVSDDEMEHVFNLGIGMLAIVAADDVRRAIDAIRTGGHDAWLVGAVVDGHGRVVMERE